MVKYDGVAIEQMNDGPKLVLFAAPAIDIAKWAGIPQRRRLSTEDGSIETAGFQREEKTSRVADLAAFMHNADNVIQNPLLAAVQDGTRVTVDTTEGHCGITIEPVDLRNLSLLELMNSAMAGLENRMPQLASRAVDPQSLAHMRKVMSMDTVDNEADQTLEDLDSAEDSADLEVGLFEEETQVVDFYDELKVRAAVLTELHAAAATIENAAGFSREFLESLVKPVVLVDGQHRLRGALKAIDDIADTEDGLERIASLIDGGLSPEEANRQFAVEVGRRLPVSLLLSDDPAEHVFQFVVVNQKATPMSSALLGTIVSTSLSQEELDPIRLRLRSAGIEIESSRSIAYLTRAPESPFKGLVATGVVGDRPGALPWSVLGKLISIVRNLEGGAPFHPPLIDYAKLWREAGFKASGLVDASLSGSERMDAWSEADGPWRQFFIKLFTKIRDKFGDQDDMNAPNAWGSTKSNLFNMISLSILTADFFAFLHTNSRGLSDWDDVDQALEDWIGDLNPAYFARDWRMKGTKKDQPTIKRAWSEAWTEYRITKDRLPRVERYNPGGRGSA